MSKYWKCTECDNINPESWFKKPTCQKCGSEKGAKPKEQTERELLNLVLQNQAVIYEKLEEILKRDDLPVGEILPEPIDIEEEEGEPEPPKPKKKKGAKK